jgi:Ti-type conjugative transfer relaxase TraA
MILKGNQRAYGKKLALHLLNVDDNEHVTVHELRGFTADDLIGALDEIEAISYGTKCKQYLFSLSLNPPSSATVSVAVFESTINDIERRLGLSGQPRAIVFHEKKGRRHAHVVWSRIDIDKMKAINLAHTKLRLMDISRELYITFGWDMPEGLIDHRKRDESNYAHDEASQAKRVDHDPAKLKAFFKACWQRSDTLNAFAHALREQGFCLARGDRRGFVAVDADGEVYSLSRWCGVKPKELQARFGTPHDLPSVEEAIALLNDQAHSQNHDDPFKADSLLEAFQTALSDLVARQRQEREALKTRQEHRIANETKARHARLPKGLKAIWARMSGQYERLCQELAQETESCLHRDAQEMQALIEKHFNERKTLERDYNQPSLRSELEAELFGKDQHRLYQPDPAQPLILPPDDAPFTKKEIARKPERILDVLSDKKARFTRSEILGALSDVFDDPFALQLARDKVLRSSKLVAIENTKPQAYTTQDFLNSQKNLLASVKAMASSGGFAVSKKHCDRAIASENKVLKKRFGASLSDEQVAAIRHVLKPNQLSCVVGLAGAGKSTLLSVARQAWEQQGYTVHGVALAGKAADSLQQASGIASRTLASLEASWKAGYEPVSHGDIVVLDEAGMVGTRQLERITKTLQSKGCKLVLVGDPDQLQPIQAGTPFKDITKITEVAHLTEIRRQKDHWQREASQDFAKGRILKAMQAYETHGAVHTKDNGQHAIAALVESYVADWQKHGDKASRLALAHRRKDVYAINQAIRAARRELEGPKPETLFKTDYGPRAFADGDRILFTRNDATLGVRNGMLGTVTHISNNKLTVRLDGDDTGQSRKLTFCPKAFPHFDHGFAVSIHRAQGCTVDRSFVLSSTTLDRHLIYVAMTRHKDSAQFFTAPDIERKVGIDVEKRINRLVVKRTGPKMG